MNNLSPLQIAISICGSQTALANKIGVRQGHVWAWLNRTKKLPPLRAAEIEIATKGAVRCEQLCPGVKFIRDRSGKVTDYQFRLSQALNKKAA